MFCPDAGGFQEGKRNGWQSERYGASCSRLLGADKGTAHCDGESPLAD